MRKNLLQKERWLSCSVLWLRLQDCLFQHRKHQCRRRIQLCKGAAVFHVLLWCEHVRYRCWREQPFVMERRLPRIWCKTSSGFPEHQHVRWFYKQQQKCAWPDGDGKVDVSGGFHDAGDHVKFGLPQAYAASTVGWVTMNLKTSSVQRDRPSMLK